MLPGTSANPVLAAGLNLKAKLLDNIYRIFLDPEALPACRHPARRRYRPVAAPAAGVQGYRHRPHHRHLRLQHRHHCRHFHHAFQPPARPPSWRHRRRDRHRLLYVPRGGGPGRRACCPHGHAVLCLRSRLGAARWASIPWAWSQPPWQREIPMSCGTWASSFPSLPPLAHSMAIRCSRPPRSSWARHFPPSRTALAGPCLQSLVLLTLCCPAHHDPDHGVSLPADLARLLRRQPLHPACPACRDDPRRPGGARQPDPAAVGSPACPGLHGL